MTIRIGPVIQPSLADRAYMAATAKYGDDFRGVSLTDLATFLRVEGGVLWREIMRDERFVTAG